MYTQGYDTQWQTSSNSYGAHWQKPLAPQPSYSQSSPSPSSFSTGGLPPLQGPSLPPKHTHVNQYGAGGDYGGDYSDPYNNHHTATHSHYSNGPTRALSQGPTTRRSTHRSSLGGEAQEYNYNTSRSNRTVTGHDDYYEDRRQRSMSTGRRQGGATHTPTHQHQPAPGEGRYGGIICLTNLGNSCFMNSVLQALAHIPPIREYVLHSRHYFETTPRGNHVGEILVRTLSSMYDAEAKGSSLQPKTLYSHASYWLGQMEPWKQHDAHECHLYFVDQLSSYLTLPTRIPAPQEEHPQEHDTDVSQRFWNDFLARNKNFLTEALAAQIKVSVQCEGCNSRSRSFDPILDLSLPLIQRKPAVAFGRRMELAECLQAYFRTEDITDRVCERCGPGRSRRHRKITTLFRLPQILVLSLMRFTSSGKKINTKVNYPHGHQLLDMAEFRDPASPDRGPSKYRLIAVVCHQGTASSGHYTAFARVDTNERMGSGWVMMNDARFEACSDQQIVSDNAYMLYFERL